MINFTDIKNAKRRLGIYSYLLHKRLRNELQNRFSKKPSIEVIKADDDRDYDSHIIDDLPLTINRDPRPGIRHEATLN